MAGVSERRAYRIVRPFITLLSQLPGGCPNHGHGIRHESQVLRGVPVMLIGSADDRWFKSRYSGPDRECVLVAHLTEGAVGVRDSKYRTGPTLYFDAAAWDEFLTSVQLDRPWAVRVFSSGGPGRAAQVYRSAAQRVIAVLEARSAPNTAGARAG
ncbi:DUF397 domain-containing protein [Nocardia rhamnosiphila]